MTLSMLKGEKMEILQHGADRQEIQARFPDLEWREVIGEGQDFFVAYLIIGGITIEFFT